MREARSALPIFPSVTTISKCVSPVWEPRCGRTIFITVLAEHCRHKSTSHFSAVHLLLPLIRPAGHYLIEAHQVGLGTAVWETDISPSSPGTRTASEQIELTFQRRTPVGQPVNAGAAAPTRAPSSVATSANNTTAASNPLPKNQSQEPNVASGQPDNATKNGGKSKQELTGIHTASQSNISPSANPSALVQQQRSATVTIRGAVHTAEGVAVPGTAVRLLDVTSRRAWDT